jgi:hypothetical protein
MGVGWALLFLSPPFDLEDIPGPVSHGGGAGPHLSYSPGLAEESSRDSPAQDPICTERPAHLQGLPKVLTYLSQLQMRVLPG